MSTTKPSAWGYIDVAGIAKPYRSESHRSSMRNAVQYGGVQELFTSQPAAARAPLTDAQIDRAVAVERDALLDYIYEHGTATEGIIERVRKLARAAVAASEKGGAK